MKQPTVKAEPKPCHPPCQRRSPLKYLCRLNQVEDPRSSYPNAIKSVFLAYVRSACLSTKDQIGLLEGPPSPPNAVSTPSECHIMWQELLPAQQQWQ